MEEWSICKHGIFEKMENLVWTDWREEEMEETEVTHVGKDQIWNQVSNYGLLSQGQEEPAEGSKQI